MDDTPRMMIDRCNMVMIFFYLIVYNDNEMLSGNGWCIIVVAEYRTIIHGEKTSQIHR